MLRFLRYVFEFLAAFIGVGIVLALLVVWRISAHPVSSSFLTPYIEAGIENIIPGSNVHVASTLSSWNNAEHAVLLHAEKIIVTGTDGAEIADIPTLDAKISIIGLMFGQFMPKDLAIDHPQIKLTRDASGAFVFGGLEVGNSAEADKGNHKTDFVLHNVAERLSHAVLMHKLAVTHAVFTVHDTVTQKDWVVNIPEISVAHRAISEVSNHLAYGALDGRMTVEVTQNDTISSVDVTYIYDPRKTQHTISANFNDVTPAFVAGGHPETLGLGVASIIDLPLTGKIQAVFDKNLSLENIVAQIHGDEGHIAYSDFWDNPCPVKLFDVKANYDRDANTLKIYDAHIDFEGPTLDFQMDGMPSAQAGKNMDFTAFVQIDNLPMNRYSELWPKPVLPDPRYWLAANLRNGTYNHAEAKVKGAMAWNDLANISVTEGGGQLSASGATVTYLDGMPPAQNVSTDATFDLNKMSARINNGNLGNIRISPFTLQINGLSAVDQDIDIPLQVSGPVTEILRLLDHPPLGYAKRLGIAPEDLTGSIGGLVEFKFPLLKTLEMKNTDIHATANATNVASTKLVPGLAIDQGNLSFALDMSGFNFKGQASLDKVPFQIVWQENFEEQPDRPLRKATITGIIKDEQWNNFGISAFNGTKGSVDVTLDMVRVNKEKTIFTGTTDMTPAALRVDMLDWKKPAYSPAVLKFSATALTGKPVAVTSLTLRGSQLTANGTATLTPDMSQVLSLNISPFILGRTNTSLHFNQSFGDNGTVSFEAIGSSLDIGGLQNSKNAAVPDPRRKDYHIQVGKLYTGDNSEFDNAEATLSRDQQGWSSISLHGLADGDTPLSVDLTPQPDGHRTFTVACDNFGKAMKGLGFTDTIKGGKLSITGQSTVDAPRTINGTAKISDFTVERLPALALLLNATSPFGFTGILTDSASFSRFEGDFRWQGDEITVMRAHAAGSAIGINADGKVDLNSGDANLQGTLVPFSVVNSVLNYIPLFGNLLTGGKDQGVLAMAYQIKGPLNAPELNVNPISLLAPGFIRNLFFRDGAAEDDNK